MAALSRRDVARGALAASAFALAGEAVMAAAAPTGHADAMQFVHPQLRGIATQILAATANSPPPSRAELSKMRGGSSKYVKPPRADVTLAEKHVPVRIGSPDVRLFIINAKPGTARPAILHTHGGGFVAGSPHDDVHHLQNIAQELDCTIVSVDYRLAPETPYFGSIEDNYAGLKWLYTNAAELGVDQRRIAVMGESAGGGHAALLAITARDRGEIPIAFQCLVSPMLDDRTGSSRQPPPSVGRIIWTAEQNRFSWASFLGTAPGGRKVPPAVPARVADLSRLPPAWIGTGSIDLFASEDLEYSRRLLEAGIMVETVVVPGAFHGFDGIPNLIGVKVPISEQFNVNKLNALRRALIDPQAG